MLFQINVSMSNYQRIPLNFLLLAHHIYQFYNKFYTQNHKT